MKKRVMVTVQYTTTIPEADSDAVRIMLEEITRAWADGPQLANAGIHAERVHTYGFGPGSKADESCGCGFGGVVIVADLLIDRSREDKTPVEDVLDEAVWELGNLIENSTEAIPFDEVDYTLGDVYVVVSR